MCLAIYCPAGKDVELEHLVEGYCNNPHGAGFSYFDEKGKVRRQRFMKFEEFLSAYEEAKREHGEHSPFSIHFRYATHGKTDVDNVHPFMYNSDTTVIHNGILDCLIDDKAMSDTFSFVENYLTSLPREWYDNEYLFDLVEQYCTGSKLVILTANPNAKHYAYIVNESSGFWENEIWYSNKSFCKEKPKNKVTMFPTDLNEQLQLEADAYYSSHDDDSVVIDKCRLCDEEAVMDNMCYYCETCQNCMMEDIYCECSTSLHKMTDKQLQKMWEMP
jgi:glutamine amidotransferase